MRAGGRIGPSPERRPAERGPAFPQRPGHRTMFRGRGSVMAVKRIWMFAALMAAAVAMLGTAGTAAADMAFSQFDTCLQKDGLSAAPDDQSASAVQVCKTVKVTKVTNYTWTLTKAAAPPHLLLGIGQG